MLSGEKGSIYEYRFSKSWTLITQPVCRCVRGLIQCILTYFAPILILFYVSAHTDGKLNFLFYVDIFKVYSKWFLLYYTSSWGIVFLNGRFVNVVESAMMQHIILQRVENIRTESFNFSKVSWIRIYSHIVFLLETILTSWRDVVQRQTNNLLNIWF